MAINNIKLRQTNHPPLTNKNAELTYGELDTNFISIYDYVVSMNSGGGVPAFVMITSYTGTKYVTYGGKIWVHVAAGPSIGIIPGTNGAVWQETTIGAIAHLPGTDSTLAAGTANEVNAADIAAVINNPIESITRATLTTLINTDALIPGKRYKVTDALAYAQIIVEAMDTNILSGNGIMIGSIPDPGQMLPEYIWNRNGTYVTDDYLAWDGYVYRNRTGVNTGSLPSADTTNWELTTTSSYYIDVAVNVQFQYLSDFTIMAIIDTGLRNYQGGMDADMGFMPVYSPNSTDNWADPTSDTGHFTRVQGPVSGNTLQGCTMIIPKGAQMEFRGNRCINGKINIADGGDIDITYCTIINAELSFPNGINPGSYLDGCNFHFNKLTTLEVRNDVGGIDGGYIGDAGGNITDIIDNTGVTTIDLDDNGPSDIYGRFVLSSSNAAETLDMITGGARICPIIIAPITGRDLTVNVTSGTTPSPDAIYVDGGANFTLVGDNGDYMVVKPYTVGGIDGWLVTKKHILA